MRVLYLAMKFDYGIPARGPSFEHHNFYHSLHTMGHDLVYFDFMTLIQKWGKQGMNRLLKEVAASEKPDVCFSILFTDQLEPETLDSLSSVCPTVNWFCDDHWRFESFTRHWAGHFSWVVTTASSALPKYAAIGYHRVIKSQWACNHFLYRKLDLPLRHEVSFVGQPHGNRRAVVEALRRAGIGVKTWGTGWSEGRLSQAAMIDVFNQSRVNLNLSNASVPADRRTASPSAHAPETLRSASPAGSRDRRGPPVTDANDQIKARNFEIPGCGGFTLTGRAEDLAACYEPGREIATFDSFADLVEKIRHYLSRDDERRTIAEAGYRRTLAEHTYAHRFDRIFTTMGLAPAAGQASEGRRSPGETLEVG